MDLTDKTVLLTGATGGIGRAFAEKLAGAGGLLILVSRDRSSLEAMAESLPGDGHRIIVADVATSVGREAIVECCSQGVDVVINNAGVNHFGLLDWQSEEQIRSMFEVNALAPILLIQSLISILVRRSSVIVNVGSGFGSIGFAGYCGYSASKFALRGFSEALRRELAASGVKVMYFAPRATQTAMNPDAVVAMNSELGNATDAPEVVAEELMRLLEKPRATRFLGWPERFFIKLNSLFPGIVDQALGKQLPIIRRHALAANVKGG
ncbi:MAG: SDR family oxidoreductase [Halioglobus sp.]